MVIKLEERLIKVEAEAAEKEVVILSAAEQNVSVEAETTVAVDVPRYTGAYTVTPSGAVQVLATAGRCMTENVTVEAVPSCYGLITYNGFEITVS